LQQLRELDRKYRMARPVKSSSEKSFGIVFAVVFLIIAFWPSIFRGANPYWWALIAAAAFLAAAFLAPKALVPLNRIWFRFGLALHHIVNPVVMALLYYGAVVPMGLIVRLAGKDPLRLKDDPSALSYWIRRQPPGPPPQSMAKQF
jgi:predicted membrane metal-binding protein